MRYCSEMDMHSSCLEDIAHTKNVSLELERETCIG
jgi:hypothetical protein